MEAGIRIRIRIKGERDPHQSDKQCPDPEPDPHQSDADPQRWSNSFITFQSGNKRLKSGFCLTPSLDYFSLL